MHSLQRLFALAALTAIASAQAQTAQFEVASIREIVYGVHELEGLKFSGPRAEYRGFGVPALIAEAWNVRGDAIALAPGVSFSAVYPILSAGRSGTSPFWRRHLPHHQKPHPRKSEAHREALPDECLDQRLAR